jgi:hypothetical protein
MGSSAGFRLCSVLNVNSTAAAVCQKRLCATEPCLLTGNTLLHEVVKDPAVWASNPSQLLLACGAADVRVDVACTERGGCFEGDSARRQHVLLRLKDVFDMIEHVQLGREHWACKGEMQELDFYLAQCSVLSNEAEQPAALPALADCFTVPSFVAAADLLQVCLWAAQRETTTNLHYDCNHNVLFILRGRSVTQSYLLLMNIINMQSHQQQSYSATKNLWIANEGSA